MSKISIVDGRCTLVRVCPPSRRVAGASIQRPRYQPFKGREAGGRWSDLRAVEAIDARGEAHSGKNIGWW
jgi:hypothetical protein